MPVVLPGRMLGPVRRWALRELKVHPGQVVVAWSPPTWAVTVLRDLIGDAGTVMVLEPDARRVQAEALVDSLGWSNVAVLATGAAGAVLPARADRVLVDGSGADPGVEVLERLVSLLGPGGRVAGVWRRGGDGCAQLEDRFPYICRESFYGGAAYAVWGQVP